MLSSCEVRIRNAPSCYILECFGTYNILNPSYMSYIHSFRHFSLCMRYMDSKGEIQAADTRYLKRLHSISYSDRVTNEVICRRDNYQLNFYKHLLITITKWELKCYDYVTRSWVLNMIIPVRIKEQVRDVRITSLNAPAKIYTNQSVEFSCWASLRPWRIMWQEEMI